MDLFILKRKINEKRFGLFDAWNSGKWENWMHPCIINKNRLIEHSIKKHVRWKSRGNIQLQFVWEFTWTLQLIDSSNLMNTKKFPENLTCVNSMENYVKLQFYRCPAWNSSHGTALWNIVYQYLNIAIQLNELSLLLSVTSFIWCEMKFRWKYMFKWFTHVTQLHSHFKKILTLHSNQ